METSVSFSVSKFRPSGPTDYPCCTGARPTPNYAVCTRSAVEVPSITNRASDICRPFYISMQRARNRSSRVLVLLCRALPYSCGEGVSLNLNGSSTFLARLAHSCPPVPPPSWDSPEVSNRQDTQTPSPHSVLFPSSSSASRPNGSDWNLHPELKGFHWARMIWGVCSSRLVVAPGVPSEQAEVAGSFESCYIIETGSVWC